MMTVSALGLALSLASQPAVLAVQGAIEQVEAATGAGLTVVRRAFSEIADFVPPSAGNSEAPRSADSFVDSVGMNTHFFFANTLYAQRFSDVSAALVAMHVRHIRDSATLRESQPAYYSHLASLVASGIHSDLVTDLHESASNIARTIALSGGSVEYVEYPNEWDNSKDPAWAADIQSYGAKLYSEKAQFGNLPIIGPSFVHMRSYSDSFAPGAFASISDIGNVHDYFWKYNPDNPGWGGYFPHCGRWATVDFWRNCARYIEPPAVVATETGWDDGATYGANGRTLSPSIVARYEMRALLSHWNGGIERTYIYALLDTGHENYGLMDNSLTPKPAYLAIASLLADLNDPGTPATLTPLTYSLSGASSVEHTLLQKRDGSYYLLIWNAVKARDPAVPTQRVQLSFAAPFASIAKRVWQDDGTVVQTTLSPSSTISLNVTDRVTELQLRN